MNILNKKMDIYGEIENKFEIQNLYRDISHLENNKKEIIYLIYFENKTLKEIGKLKNLNYKQVANIRNKILKKLKLLIKN